MSFGNAIRRHDTRTLRCSACGERRSTIPCFAHPDADLIDWPTKLHRAYIYVVAQAAHVGGDTDRLRAWVTDRSHSLWPGVDNESALLALMYWERWGRQELPERRLKVAVPLGSRGLFG